MRPPVVAGQFYAGFESSLQEQIEWCYTHEYGPGNVPEVKVGPRIILGLVSPHAGYPYSGPVAAHGFRALAEDGMPQTVVLVGPAHRQTQGVFVDTNKRWSTPLGQVEVDLELTKEITSKAKFIIEDPVAHFEEHSLEVQLPFLQHLFGSGFRITPIIMGVNEMSQEISVKLGNAIVKAIKKLNRDVLVLASSDFIHYGIVYGYVPVTGSVSEILRWIKRVDQETISKIEKLNVSGFFEVLKKYNSTTCGFGPIAVVMTAVKALGAKTRTLKYATSSETTGGGGTSQIVGYASIVFEK